ncbi:hypothetical protein LJK87_42885 [Paenibacillus sp. P25]|nr:hypothetical protein LJK87_42885 [Paenibacillus sp. P25]
MFFQRLQQGFFGNVRKDILSGLTVAFALIPEAIAFSIMAGVDPMIGLYASFTIAVTISFFGGRPGMISAATGAMASLMGPLVAAHGVEYLFAATVLTGILQWLLGVVKFGRFITFVPQSVIVGFVNALAIIIFMAQVAELRRRIMADVPDGGGNAADHISAAASDQSRSVGAGRDHCDDGDRRPDRG